MGELVSVIIPVYNQEQYVCECIESVLVQTYQDFEILIIDDGSTDGSLKLCKDTGKMDQRIRILTQAHGGVSAARNRGIREAGGKYLFFLDSDDLIHPKLLETLCKLQEKNGTALAAGGFYRAPGGKFCMPEEWKCTQECAEDSFCIENSGALDYRVFSDTKLALYGIGGKLILRKAAAEVRFDERLTHGEDTRFLYQLIANGADISILRRNWYYYRKNEQGEADMPSVRACRSRYMAERYMCRQEIKNGRIANAIGMEEIIISSIAWWYETANTFGNKELVRYMRYLANREKAQKIFTWASWYRKAKIYLIIYCPYYRFYRRGLAVCDLLACIWSNRWRIRQALGRIKQILAVILLFEREQFEGRI